MKSLIDQSELLTEGDYLSLSMALSVRSGYLIDKTVGARHRLQNKVAKLLGLLNQPIPVELWYQYARRQGLSPEEVRLVIIFLNGIGGLKINRGLKGHFRVFRNSYSNFSKGRRMVRLSRRWPANLVSASKATVITMVPLVCAVLVTAFLAYGINVEMRLTVEAIAGFLSAIWLSTVVHEQVHNLIIARVTSGRIFVQRGLRIGLMYGKSPNKIEIVSALSGPLAGIIAGLIYSFVLGQVCNQAYLFNAVGLLVAAFHTISFLPGYADGKILWRIIRGHREV